MVVKMWVSNSELLYKGKFEDSKTVINRRNRRKNNTMNKRKRTKGPKLIYLTIGIPLKNGSDLTCFGRVSSDVGG
jgi:hypothetical protein